MRSNLSLIEPLDGHCRPGKCGITRETPYCRSAILRQEMLRLVSRFHMSHDMQKFVLLPLTKKSGAGVLIQLAVIGPMNIYFPFAVGLSIAVVYTDWLVRRRLFLEDAMILMGLLGFIGQYSAILFPQIAPRPKWPVRLSLGIMIVLGFVAEAMNFKYHLVPDKWNQESGQFFKCYLFGGFAVVGLWNLYRLVWPRNEPVNSPPGQI
jgi:hypothetical protein